MHKPRILKALALIAAGLTMALAGCSGSGATSGGGTESPTKTYTNDQYGFSMTYDQQLTQGEPVNGTGSEAGGSAVFNIAFVDTSGAKDGENYIEGIQVSVYELTRSVKPSEVKGLATEVESIATQMLQSLSGAKADGKFSPTTINGTPGFTLGYTYTQGDTPMTGQTFFLFNGSYEYQLTAQSTTTNWATMNGVYDAAIQSFTVK